MKEHTRFAIHGQPAIAKVDRSAVEVPVRHVVLRLPVNVHAIEQPRNEINPPLVNEHPFVKSDLTIGIQPLLPPLQEGSSSRSRTDGEEAKVVRSASKISNSLGLWSSSIWAVKWGVRMIECSSSSRESSERFSVMMMSGSK